MDVLNILSLFGGLALFLFGMSTMSAALEKAAGSRLEGALERLAGNKYKGFLLGLLVTSVIQSSSATTVMVVGFVNAGVMRLTQTVGIIMGANIGTTVTAQILRLGDIPDEGGLLLRLVKPSGLTPVFLLIGFLLYITGARRRRRDVGLVLIGFGVLFTGMMSMEASLAPLRDVAWFRNLFLTFSNPLLGLLIGTVVTGIIQSSSASVGILQALSSTGQIPFSSAAPIILGQNIGTCVTALISSVGANRNARRAAVIHLYFNVIGAALFMVIFYLLRPQNFLSFWNDPVDRGLIANFHSIFNAVSTLILLPFSNLLVRLATWTVGRGTDGVGVGQLIDDRFLNTPTLALDQARSAVLQMAGSARQNLEDVVFLTVSFDEKCLQRILEVEENLDRWEVRLGNYLVRLADRDLREQESAALSELLHVIGNIERIGDYAINVAESVSSMAANGISFSSAAQRELSAICRAVREIFDATVECLGDRRADAILEVEPLEEVVDLLADTIKARHIERLKASQCSIEAGTALLEMLINLERIADHCSNIAASVSQTHGRDRTSFDAHAQRHSLHIGENPLYTRRYDSLAERFMSELDG